VALAFSVAINAFTSPASDTARPQYYVPQQYRWARKPDKAPLVFTCFSDPTKTVEETVGAVVDDDAAVERQTSPSPSKRTCPETLSKRRFKKRRPHKVCLIQSHDKLQLTRQL